MRAFILTISTHLLVVCLLQFHQEATAQLYPVPLGQRMEQATLIVEGRITEQFSFWNMQRTLIYTSNLVEVTKVFKGEFAGTEVEIITEGGRIGDNLHEYSETVQLRPGQKGVFFLETTPVTNSGRSVNSGLRTQVYASMQGFLRYDDGDRSASGPFEVYPDIQTGLFQHFIRAFGPYRTIVPIHQPLKPSKGETRLAATPTITSFTPTTVNAGTYDVITITGTNFGSPQSTGTVGFRSADDAGATLVYPVASQYVSWTDTQIKVWVPSKAGTGTIVVTNSDPAAVTSSGTLTVTYALLNASFYSPAITKRTRFVNRNANGGLSWRMFTGFNSSTDAREAFLRAFKNWRCSTTVSGGVNWDLGPTTSVDMIAEDGVSVVRFDIGSELPVGILGRCTSYWSISTCTGTPPDSNTYVKELDIVFDSGTSWYYGTGSPGGSDYDFESVALHELGHGHQLAHVIATSDVMHYSISAGDTRRVLSSGNISAGNSVLTLSTTTTCSVSPMSSVTANAGPDTIVCSGTGANLLAKGGVTYSWTPSAGLSSTTIPNPVATPSSTTTYTVSITNGTCHSSSDAVVVTPWTTSVVADAGADKSICVGDSVVIGTADGSASMGTIGTGTSTATTTLYNTADEDQKTQIVFTKAELNTAGITDKRYINKIAFSVSSIAGTKAMSSFSVGMGNTTATSMSGGWKSVTTVLALTSYTPKVGWDTLSFDTPFLWDGLSNLVVQICFDNTGAPSSSGYATHYTLTPGLFMIGYTTSLTTGCSYTGGYTTSTARPNIRIFTSLKQFVWSPTSGLRFSTDANPKASPASTTTYMVSVKDTVECGNSDPMVLTVYPTDPTSLTWTGAVNTSWSTVGNWDAPCAIPTTGDAVTIPIGTTPPASIPAMTLGSLSYDNATGTSLAADVSITGTLTLTAGKISLGANNLTISSTGGISGGSSSSFIVTDGTGQLRQADIGSGGKTGTVAFPVGNSSTSYVPATIINSGTSDEFRVRVTGSVLSDGTSGSTITSDAVNKSWHISEATAGGSSATVTLQWNGVDELTGFDRTSCVLTRHDGTSWSWLSSLGPASGSDPYTRSASGISTFGVFAVVDASSTLPVELASFTARKRGETVLLEWITASEVNSLYFDVERMDNRTNEWLLLEKQPARGSSDGPVHYSFIDRFLPQADFIVYRLRQVDRDGSSSYSREVRIALEQVDGFVLHRNYPNPFNPVTDISFTLGEEQHVTLTVLDPTGRTVATLLSETRSVGTHSIRFQSGDLPAGTYYYRVLAGREVRFGAMTLLK